MPKIVVGFLSGPSGLGQSARLAAAALRVSGYSVYGVDLSAYFYERPGFVSHGLPDGFRCRGPAHVIAVINAPFIGYALSLLGRSFLSEKFVTGYWAWELPSVPDSWGSGYGAVHDVAAPSRFAAAAIAAHRLGGAVAVAPHPVTLDHPPIKEWSGMEARRTAPFTVASIMSVSSGFARKNPVALLRAFDLAFGASRTCQLKLIVTGVNRGSREERMILDAARGRSNVHLQRTPLERRELYNWWREASVFALLHRSEGFGLPLAEAMCAGFPVIGTGWSGNMDFMCRESAFPVRYRLVDVEDPQAKYCTTEGQWADPDADHAAEILLDLARDRSLGPAIGQRARAKLLDTLSPVRFVEPILS